MFPRWIGLLTIFLAISACAQTNTDAVSLGSTRMLLPPAFTTTVPLNDFGNEATGNFLSYGLVMGTAYNDNVLPEQSTHAIGDNTYSLHPLLTLQNHGTRLTQQFTYSPGFTIYQRTSALNDVDQHLAESLDERLSENMSVSVEEDLDKSSNAFSQTENAAQPGVPVFPISGAVAPYANQLSNTATFGWRYQYGENSLVGATGGYALLHYLNPAQSDGLANTSTADASGFYLHRFAARHYLGAVYQFTQMTVSPTGVPQLHIRLNAVAGSYTVYFTRSFLFSLTAGPQRLQLEDSQLPQYESWKPWIQANITWQADRTALTAAYSRTATTGGGLEGIFETDTIGLSGRWQPAPHWTLGAAGGYLESRPETTFLTATGGHGYSFSFLTMRRLSENWNLQFEYDRLYQRYPGVVAITGNPVSNREAISLSYAIKRHLAQ